MQNVFVQRSTQNQTLVTRVVILVSACIFGGLALFVQPATSHAINLSTWATTTAAGNNDSWRALTYGNGRFVAVGSSGDRVMYSDDALTWTAVATTSAADNNDSWQSVTYGNGRFVAVACGSGTSCNTTVGDRVMHSTDGIIWATTTAAGDNDGWYDVVYGNGRFVAVGYNGDRVMTSTDGLTWATTTAAGDDDNWYSVTYGEGTFVAVGQSADRVMYSGDGLTWIPVGISIASNVFLDVEYGNGRFVAIENTGSNLIYSDDGIVWSVSDSQLTYPQTLIFGNGIFIAHDTSYGTFSYSVDGATWVNEVPVTSDLFYYDAGDFANNRFVFVDQNKPVLYLNSSPWSLTQTGFQFRNDNGSEIAATNFGGQNSTLQYPVNTPVRFRTQIDSALATTTNPYYLQYKPTTGNTWHTVGVDGNYPSIVATSSGGTGTTDVTTHTITMPECSAGNSILVVFSYDGAGTSYTTDDGWVKLGEQSNAVAVSGAIYYKKVATDTFVDSLYVGTRASEQSTHIAYCIKGGGTPTASAQNGGSTNSNPPVHNTDAVRNNLWIATRSGDAQVVATGTPSSYGGLLTQVASGANGASTNVAHRYLRASTTDPGTFTSLSEQWVSWTIAVPPAQTPTAGNITLANGVAPSTGANDAGIGSITWTNPGNATTSNDSQATLTVSSTTASNYLAVTGYGFAIPTGATITGIEAQVERHRSGGTVGHVQDHNIRLVKAGAVTGNNFAFTGIDWQATAVVSTYGSTTNLWGDTWTPADINASNFGIAIAVQGGSVGDNRIANIDHVIINVYYTLPSPIGLASSTHIATGGASTTARLIAPGAYATTDFTGGHITDDQSPTPTIVVGDSAYTELEWNIIATSTATTGDVYKLRVTNGAEGNMEYKVNAQWTIGSSITPGTFALTGTIFNEYGTTSNPGAGVPVVLAVSQDGNPVLYSTTTTAGGAYSVTVATGTTPGSSWSAVNAAGDDDSWDSIAYGNGLFVAAGNGTNVMTSPDGISWTVGGIGMYSVVYGNGLFVAAVSNGQVVTSPDGITWSTHPHPANYLYQITYGEGRFVSVGIDCELDPVDGECFYYSDDGVTWLAGNNANTSVSWGQVYYGGGRFIALIEKGSSTTTTLYSDDGINWVTASLYPGDISNQYWQSVAYGNGRFVAVGDNARKSMYSLDGDSWYSLSAAGDNDFWYGITYGNGYFVAVGQSFTDDVMFSADGISWTAVATSSAAGNNDDWRAVTYGNGRFVAVGQAGDRVMYSAVGLGPETPYTLYSNSTTTLATTYLKGASGASAQSNVNLYGGTVLAYNATTSATSSITKLDDLSFFDSSFDSSILYTAPPGATTTIHADFITATGTTRAPGRLSLGGDFTQLGTFDSYGGAITFTSGDSVVNGNLIGANDLNDVTINTTRPGVQNWIDQTFGNFLDIGFEPVNAISKDGRIIAVSTASLSLDVVAYSDNDGVTWSTSTAAGDDESWRDLAYSDSGRIVAVGSAGTDRVMYSDDNGLTWATTSAAGNNDGWFDIVYGNGRFVAVGSSGDRVMYSDDNGLTWATTSAAGDNDSWVDITYGNNTFVAITNGASGDRVMYSTDGITWATTSPISSPVLSWQEVTFGDGVFVAAAEGDNYQIVLMYSTNGINWATSTVPYFAGLEYSGALAYHNGVFVAIHQYAGSGLYSYDGIIWNEIPEIVGLYGCNIKLIAGHGKNFIAFDEACSVAKSLSGSIFATSTALGNLEIASDNTLFQSGATSTLTGSFSNAGTINNRGTFILAGTSTILSAQASPTAVPQIGAVIVTGSTTLATNASTTDFMVANGATVITSSQGLSVSGDFTQNGTYQSTSTVLYFDGGGEVQGSLAGTNSLGYVVVDATHNPWIFRNAAGNNDKWYAATYGNGRFVAVGGFGASDRVMYSDDNGITWTIASAANDDDYWSGITYGNGRFVAVGYAGDRVITSTDGLTWTAVATSSAAGNNDSWNAVTYGNGRFVAVGQSGDRVMTSADGLTWTAVATSSASGNDDSWRGVTYGNGRFVAVGGSASTDRIMTSTDGLTWTAVATSSAAGNNDFWQSVTYGNGRFVAVSNSLGDRIMTSPDGLVWAPASVAGNNDSWESVAYGNGTFVAVSSYGDKVVYTKDGVNWDVIPLSSRNDGSWNAVTYGNGRFVAVGYVADRVMYADDFTREFTSAASTTNLTIATTSTVLAPTSTLAISGNFENRGLFYPRAGTTTFSGTGNTITGNLTFLDETTNSPDYGLTNITGSYTYIGNGTTSVLTIQNGASLTAPSSGLLTVAHNFINNGTFTNNGATTTFGGNLSGTTTGTSTLGNTVINARSQGLEWQVIATSSAAGNDDGWRGITYGNGRFVAVGQAGDRVMTSTDGLTWATVSAAGNNDGWNSVAYGNGRFVAVGGDVVDNVMTSTDGLTWATTSAAGNNDGWTQVTYGNGRFVAVGQAGDRVMTSTDGLTWATTSAAGNDDTWRGVTYGNGRFVAVSSVGDNTSMSSTDGLTWTTAAAVGDNDYWWGITFGNGRFVAVSYGGNDRVMYSYDGLAWIGASAAGNNDGWQEVAYGNGRFVAVGYNGDDRVMSSDDGIIWTAIATTSAAGNDDSWHGVTYGNGRFVAVSYSGDRILTSLGATNLFSNASTTNLTITASSTLNASGTSVSVAGNYTNLGTLVASTSTFIFDGTSTQVATGTLNGSSTFNNLTITNTSGNGTTTQSVQFGAPVSATGTVTMLASTSARFLASSTNTFNNVTWQGGSTAPVWLRSSVPDTQWNLDIDGTKNVSFVNVRDSNATTTTGGIINTSGFDSGNNINWNFGTSTPLQLGIDNHPLGQVNNTFASADKIDEPLFAFRLVPEIETASTTITVTLANTIGLDSSNLSDWRLYRDINADGLLDGGDVQVGGAGTFSTTSVIFATPFLATTSQSYIVTADVTAIEQGDRVTISLTPATINATSTLTSLALPVVGTISSTNHLRSKKGAGGGSVNFINIGAPGNGIVGGGSNEGGEELGGEPNFNPPGSNGSPHNEWTSGGSGYLSDGSYTTETTAGQRQSYGTYGFSIPSDNQINGIEVKLEASASTPAGTIEVALSWDNGTSITTVQSTATLTTTDTIYTLGSPSDLWGRAWVPSEFSNGTFGIRLIGQPSGGNTVQVDAMQVRVYHQATGGGAGGGGGEL